MRCRHLKNSTAIVALSVLAAYMSYNNEVQKAEIYPIKNGIHNVDFIVSVPIKQFLFYIQCGMTTA